MKLNELRVVEGSKVEHVHVYDKRIMNNSTDI